jgi:hypothetical protein
MSNLTCHHDRVPTQTSSGPCVRIDPVAREAPQTTLRQLAPSRVARTEKQNPLTCSRRHLAIPGGGVTRTRTGQTESALTPPWPSATAAKPTAKHIPQHRTDTGCAPDKAQTLSGPEAMLATPTRARRRSIASRSLRMSPLPRITSHKKHVEPIVPAPIIPTFVFVLHPFD